MNLPESYLEQMPEWSTATLYEQFLGLEPPKKIAEKVKYGVNMKFHINRLLNEWYTCFPTTNKVRIMGCGMCDLNAFTDEVDERKAIMANFILSMYSGETTESRVNENGEIN